MSSVADQQSVLRENYRVEMMNNCRKDLLVALDAALPWDRLIEQLSPAYPSGKRGRRPIGLSVMLRLYIYALIRNASDQVAVDELEDCRSAEWFCGWEGGVNGPIDRTTLTKFRSWLAAQNFAQLLDDTVNDAMDAVGLKVRTGTVVDSTLVGAPRSRKNRDKAPTPGMTGTVKGGQMYFGMKVHIGADSKTNRIHRVSCTPANVHDSTAMPKLMHGGEREVYGDSAYQSQLQKFAPHVKDRTNRRAARNRPLTPQQQLVNHKQNKVRAKVEHCFRIIKCQFGQRRTRYRGLAKNATHFATLVTLANVYQFREQLRTA